MKTFKTHSVEETRALGATLARESAAGSCYILEGDLGAGKTEFVRGFMEELAAGAPVKSPSFAIVNCYETAKFPVYHFDFYRLTDASELMEIGFYEYIATEGVCLIEWGTMFPEVLPTDAILLRFKELSMNDREIEISPLRS